MPADDTEQALLERYYRAGEVFTPSAPIDSKDLFSGRRQQIAQVIDAINQTGQHAILFGERGVGKTSLANVIHDFWRGNANIVARRINCLSNDSYTTLWARAFGEIETTRESQSAGFRHRTTVHTSTIREDVESEELDPDNVRHVLEDIGRQVALVLFFDEFDVLNPIVRKTMAETVKMLSDFSVPATLIFVGVADSVNDLISDHESVERAIVQVALPRMPDAELRQIVERGLDRLSMSIDSIALTRITSMCLGLPYYTHLIALHAARHTLERQMLVVDTGSVDLGVGEALKRASQSLINAYNIAVHSSQRGHLYRQVLTACARAKTNDVGFFTPATVRNPLSQLMGRPYDVPSYIRHLNEFAGEKRGRILIKAGAPRSYRFRFANPLMQPYVLMQARTQGWFVA